MVCLLQAPKKQQNTEPCATHPNDDFDRDADTAVTTTKGSSRHTCGDGQPVAGNMNFGEATDRLQLQYLAGCDIVSQPPLFSPNGEYLFLISNNMIKVYGTATGELIRELLGGAERFIAMEIELNQTETLVTCTADGVVLHWLWRTGELQHKTTLNLRKGEVLNFKLINLYMNCETACAVATVKVEEKCMQWFVFNTNTGERLHVPCHFRLEDDIKPLLATSKNAFKTFVLVQDCKVVFINFQTWEWRALRNAHRVPVSVVRVHPTEDLVATGDVTGRIFLWRQYMSPKTVATSLYHWHHTAVTSIAFSPAGSGFYSSGLESVLVKWNIDRPNERDFLPRMSSIIWHIAVSEDNTKVAVCTADNGVQFVGNDNEHKRTLQEFTYIVDDKTGKSKFPVGLRQNPRTSTLVLNGRMGHLQFYSAHTKHFLYNLDIVMQNQLSMETGKILYNICVTKAAFNINWMATGEVYNDEEHLSELRLKFWKFQEESQSYVLNTNIEMPHEGGFRALEFSNAYQVDNLLCASVGDDNIIRVWSLEESDNIYKQGKVWYCIAQANYKNMTIDAVSFSQDGSLLAAGCGNTLCVYKADTLQLKAALTTCPGHDGGVHKVQVRVPSKDSRASGSRSELIERRKRLMQQLTNLLEKNDDTLIKELKKTLQPREGKQKTAASKQQPVDKIEDEQLKMQLFKKILQMPELNLYQKVLLYQRLGIRCKVPLEYRARMMSYLRESVAPTTIREKTAKLRAQVHRINMRERFKAKYRLQQYETHKRHYDAAVSQNLVPLLSVLSLSETSTSEWRKANGLNRISVKPDDSDEEMLPAAPSEALRSPAMQMRTQITHVQFAASEYAHLVVACTESRVIIWNLLTLRLHAELKLSVAHLAFDPQTNLLGAVTKLNELYVFQPNVPLPIYQRSNMPPLYGAIWLPRRYPKRRSINVDWQSQSMLYFLTEQQEIMYLGTQKDVAAETVSSVTFNHAASESLRYSTFGTYATKQISEKDTNTKLKLGPMILGNTAMSAANSFTEMSAHAMPPLNLLCKDFVKLLVKPAETATAHQKALSTKTTKPAGAVVHNGHGSHSDSEEADEADESQAKIKVRKSLLRKEAEVQVSKAQDAAQPTTDLETQLQRIAGQNIQLDF